MLLQTSTFIKLIVLLGTMERHEPILTAAGLSRNEAKVYLALLDLKTATAVEITRKSKVHRVNVYDVLERLREKGLISAVMEAKKRLYSVADPEQLLHL